VETELWAEEDDHPMKALLRATFDIHDELDYVFRGFTRCHCGQEFVVSINVQTMED